jgi:hypothetical protein
MITNRNMAGNNGTRKVHEFVFENFNVLVPAINMEINGFAGSVIREEKQPRTHFTACNLAL